MQVKGTVKNFVYCKLVIIVKLVDSNKVTCKVNRLHHFTRCAQLSLAQFCRTKAMCFLKNYIIFVHYLKQIRYDEVITRMTIIMWSVMKEISMC